MASCVLYGLGFTYGRVDYSVRKKFLLNKKVILNQFDLAMLLSHFLHIRKER